jgi:hypothetical protein
MMAGYGSKNDEEALKERGDHSHSKCQRLHMPTIYGSCDIYATATRWEGFDLPLLEAQSFQNLVCYDMGAHREVTSPQSAFIVKDKEAVYQKVAASFR